jgi:carboxypeptidase Q
MLFFLLACSSTSTAPAKDKKSPSVEQIVSVDPILESIHNSAMNSDTGMDMLIELCDDIGPRLAGSDAYNKAADWGREKMEQIGLEQTLLQPIRVRYWNRGAESLVMSLPRSEAIPMLGLGMSIGTPPQGITAPIVVISTFEELETTDVRGKIVVYNAPFEGYGKTVRYRTAGPTKAAQKGAVAALVRSVTSRSLSTPHTGSTSYEEDAKIPAAAITIEDAERFARYQKRGIPVSLTLYMEAQMEENMPASNVLGEIVGSSRPDEVVAIGCHLDSWDVGQGAQDDGAGCAIVLDAARILASLDQKPKRTIRVVLFGNEENGLAGAKAYAERYAAQHVAAIEADIGAGTPQYFRFRLPEGYTKMDTLKPIFDQNLQHLPLKPIQEGYAGADINPLIQKGVLGFGLGMDSTEYWPIHHTHADTIDKIDIQNLRTNTSAMATMAWTLANIPELSQ